MFLDPKKIAASLAISGVILALGIFSLNTQNPSLAITRFLPPLASTNSFNSVNDTFETVNSSHAKNDVVDEQISPENATMEAEAMMASMNTNYPTNNDDWSLELISDHALEINR